MLCGARNQLCFAKKGTPGLPTQTTMVRRPISINSNSWQFYAKPLLHAILAFVLEITEYGEFDGKTVPTKVEACPQKFFFFDRDRVLRLYSNEAKDGIDVMSTWPNKFILVQHEPTLLNPYGIGLLDIAYWMAVGLNGNFEFISICRGGWRGQMAGKYPPVQKTKDFGLAEHVVQLRNTALRPSPMVPRSSR